MKWMTLKEFQALGFLQELNRCFLHPLGLAMAVKIEGEGTINSAVEFSGIWDCRDDPEGIMFEPSDVASATFAKNAFAVSRLKLSKEIARCRLFDSESTIQAIPDTSIED